jgi:rare lipoprotein A (peptidoglycan hydrolase)
LSPSSRITRSASATLAVLGALAIVAAFAIGITGWPPARATAATDASSPLLGIDDASVTRLPAEATTADKFGPSVMVAAAAGGQSLTSRHALRTDARRRTSGVGAGTLTTGTRTRGWARARVSWYGPGFYGHTMAGGGKLRRDSMVVAHRSLPFGTRVQFVYRGRTVTAVVRDRGPFIHGRIFDLGPGTARALGFSGVGTVKYRIVRS